MTLTFTRAIAIGVTLALAPVAAAAASLTGSAPQTSTAQNFAFDFVAPVSNGTDGILTINARGDYGRLTSEVLSFDIDGIASGGPFGAFPDVLGPGPDFGGLGGPFESVIIHPGPFDDYEFVKKITISGADLLAITADNAVTISLLLGSGVTNLNNESFVSVSLDYAEVAPVPLPAAGLPLLSALGGLALLRRRRRKTA